MSSYQLSVFLQPAASVVPSPFCPLAGFADGASRLPAYLTQHSHSFLFFTHVHPRRPGPTLGPRRTVKFRTAGVTLARIGPEKNLLEALNLSMRRDIDASRSPRGSKHIRTRASAAMPSGFPKAQKLTYRSIPTAQGTLPTAQLGYQ